MSFRSRNLAATSADRVNRGQNTRMEGVRIQFLVVTSFRAEMNCQVELRLRRPFPGTHEVISPKTSRQYIASVS